MKKKDKKQKNKLFEGFVFLFPQSVIKNKYLNKKDVKNVKDNISHNFVIIRFIASLVIYILVMALMIYMNAASNGDMVSKYGFFSIVSQISSMFGCLVCFIFELLVILLKKNNAKIILNRIAGDVLFLSFAIQMFTGLYADATMGFLNHEALSASIIIISVLILLQPSYWIDALVLDVGVSVTLFVLGLHCHLTFGLTLFHYYAIVALVFPLCCYLVVSLLFYAECQHYCDILENERLNDKAYYDNLTLCKNRYALSEFLKDNSKQWENKENANVLIILFDIDNFKQYNDQFSHLGGDYCLKSIAEAIRKAFPSPSLDFFRYGGEEFLLFFELEDPSEAKEIMEKVRNSIKTLDIEAPKGAPKNVVTISLGGLLVKNVQRFSFEEEMKLVDSYLYLAKASGKDISCFNGDLIK